MHQLRIHELFYSIQGEGKWMGTPNVFIRTTGCNLRCTYCDTTQAYTEGESKTIDEIIEQIESYHCQKICITGGEPLLQPHLPELIEALHQRGYELSIETNGSQPIQSLLSFKKLFISMDIKCPSSTMQDQTLCSNIELLRPYDQVKFVIGTRQDYSYATNILETYQPCSLVYFQPVWGFSLETLSKWVLKDQLSVHIGIQLHKYIWGDETQQ